MKLEIRITSRIVVERCNGLEDIGKASDHWFGRHEMLCENRKLIDPHLDWGEQAKSIQLEVDQDRARAIGLTPQDVAQTLQTLLTGFTVTQYREGIESIDVVARAVPAERLDLDRLPSLTISTRNGVAVPHTKHPSADRLVATVAISQEGVDFASLDGESVYILFLLVSPPDRPGDHLRGLENISRHLRNQTFCNFLRQAKSREDVLQLLREADENQLE